MDYQEIIEAIRQAGGGLSLVADREGRMSRPRCGMRGQAGSPTAPPGSHRLGNGLLD